MIQTEGDYIRSLQLVIDNYLPEMTKDSVPHSLRGKRNVIFGNIEKIYEFHSQVFQEELQQCEGNPFSAGRIFMDHVSFDAIDNPACYEQILDRLLNSTSMHCTTRTNPNVTQFSLKQAKLSSWYDLLMPSSVLLYYLHLYYFRRSSRNSRID
jgi:hypothetical protein